MSVEAKGSIEGTVLLTLTARNSGCWPGDQTIGIRSSTCQHDPSSGAAHIAASTHPTGPAAFGAASGKALFEGKARCSECHVPPVYTDVTQGPSIPLLHDPAEVGAGTAYTDRSATGLLRTTPLRALWQHPPYFHDGRADDLPAVIENYVTALPLELSQDEKDDLVEFLKSL
jgi:hypothetical protein